MQTIQAFIRHACVLCLLMTLAACGSAPQRSSAPHGPSEPITRQPAASDPIKSALYAQYQQWQGTPYRYGGLSKRGVDCSGFVYLTFRQQFDQTLPRTTAAQARLGHSVSRAALQPGDLVFFRTDVKVRHVGIYVEEGRFLHASTSEGVMLSSLREPYWSSRYWKSQRLAEVVAER